MVCPASSRSKRLNSPVLPDSAGLRGALPQPFIEHIAIDHTDKATIDRHIYLFVRWRYHARGVDAGDQQMIGNLEIADQPRRNSAAARLDAPGAIKQQHLPPELGEVVRGGRAGRSSTDDHHIECFGSCHHPAPPAIALADRTANVPCRVMARRRTMNPDRHDSRDHKQASLGCKDHGVGQSRRCQQIMRDIAGQRSQEAADAERKRLRRAP